MTSVFLKVYYRPGTDTIVAFGVDYTEKKFKIISTINGIKIDNSIIPVRALIEYTGKFIGDVVLGSEECRFRSGNDDYICKTYLLVMQNSSAVAESYVKNIRKKFNNLDLHFR